MKLQLCDGPNLQVVNCANKDLFAMTLMIAYCENHFKSIR